MEKEKNGWKELLKSIQYNLDVMKETMLNLDRKITEVVVKYAYLEKRVEKIEDEKEKKNFQSFYLLLGGIISFISGLILFILSIITRGKV